MSDDTKTTTGIDRRRFIKGAGAGVAIAWTAPIITGMNARAFAAGSCLKGASIFQFVTAQSTPGTGASQTGPFVTPNGTLTVATGNVDFVGPGTGFDPGFTPVKTMDLTGDESVTVTLLQGVTLPPGAYVIELEIYGSVGGGTGSNALEIKIGGTTVLDAGTPDDGETTLYPFSATAPSASGLLELQHTSNSDNRGLFLKRLEVFAATC